MSTAPFARTCEQKLIVVPTFDENKTANTKSVIAEVHLIAKDHLYNITDLAALSPFVPPPPPPPPPPGFIKLKPFEQAKVDISFPIASTEALIETEEVKCCCFRLSDLYLGPLALVITISALATYILTRPGIWLGEALHYLGMRGLANFVPLAIAGAGGFFPGICYLGAHAAFDYLEKLDPPSDPIRNYVHGLHSWMCTTVHDPLVELTNFS